MSTNTLKVKIFFLFLLPIILALTLFYLCVFEQYGKHNVEKASNSIVFLKKKINTLEEEIAINKLKKYETHTIDVCFDNANHTIDKNPEPKKNTDLSFVVPLFDKKGEQVCFVNVIIRSNIDMLKNLVSDINELKETTLFNLLASRKK